MLARPEPGFQRLSPSKDLSRPNYMQPVSRMTLRVAQLQRLVSCCEIAACATYLLAIVVISTVVFGGSPYSNLVLWVQLSVVAEAMKLIGHRCF